MYNICVINKLLGKRVVWIVVHLLNSLHPLTLLHVLLYF